MRSLAILLAAGGCGQIFGLDPPVVSVDVDAPRADSSATLDAGPDAAADVVTITFQQGVAGYVGALDTFIDSAGPNQDHSNDNQLRWKDNTRYTLLRFGDIFAVGGVPPGAPIKEARLELVVDQNAATGEVHEVTMPWADTASYNTFGLIPGVQADEVGDLIAPAPTALGTQSVIVTQSLSKWSADPTLALGWIIVPLPGGSDSVVRSSDDGAIAKRPRLSVTYMK